MKKYTIHICYLAVKDLMKDGNRVEEQIVSEYDWLLPAMIYYIRASMFPRTIPELQDNPATCMLLQKLFEYRVKLYCK